MNNGQLAFYCRKNLVEAHGWLLFVKTHMCVPSSFTSWWITWSKLSSGSSLGTGMLDVPDRVNLWDDVCKSVWNFERKWWCNDLINLFELGITLLYTSPKVQTIQYWNMSRNKLKAVDLTLQRLQFLSFCRKTGISLHLRL